MPRPLEFHADPERPKLCAAPGMLATRTFSHRSMNNPDTEPGNFHEASIKSLIDQAAVQD